MRALHSRPMSGPALPPNRILPVIVISQFAGSAPWFATNAVMPDLIREWGLAPAAVGTLTSAVQLGFIAGALVFAALSIADRFSPRRVFLLCALATAAANCVPVLFAPGPAAFDMLLVLRFVTGFFLAGIYPVGMKIASGWYAQGLGAALGFLVGALVLGTAAPHGLRAIGASWPWQSVMVIVSALAAGAGLLMHAFVPDGPHLARGARIDRSALRSIWTDPRVRASAVGYFGHMWELYAFWVLVPAIALVRFDAATVPAWSFAVIGAGSAGCVIGGLAVRRYGGARVAAWQLATSGVCCLLTPLMFDAPAAVFAAWLLVWGITVAGDSPQFSALTAQNAPRASVGSVLTLVNCIGFSISIVSIQLFAALAQSRPLTELLPWLAIGPVLGLWGLLPLLRAARPG